jgi:hypothetical protein
MLPALVVAEVIDFFLINNKNTLTSSLGIKYWTFIWRHKNISKYKNLVGYFMDCCTHWEKMGQGKGKIKGESSG